MVLSLLLLAGEKITIGGLELKTLKKLKGLRFILPALSIVLAKQMGLGAIALLSHCCFSIVDICEKSICIFSPQRQGEAEVARS